MSPTVILHAAAWSVEGVPPASPSASGLWGMGASQATMRSDAGEATLCLYDYLKSSASVGYPAHRATKHYMWGRR